MVEVTIQSDYASKDFKWSELACKCGCGIHNISPQAITALQALRDYLGVPLVITSGARCPQHNKDVGGAPNSHHLSTPTHQSDAFDVLLTAALNQDLITVQAEKAGFRGMGLGKTFTHLDTRPSPVKWRYGINGQPIGD